jgi:hypothetical protein
VENFKKKKKNRTKISQKKSNRPFSVIFFFLSFFFKKKNTMTLVQYRNAPYYFGFSGKTANLNYPLIVDKVVSTLIDEATLQKIEDYLTLSLYDLIIPSENFRTGKIPRPQNSFIIYRRNYQASLALSDTTNANATLDEVSKTSSNSWNKETQEVKKLFNLLAECAKEVHNFIYPNYVYNPSRKHAATSIPMLFKSKRYNRNPLRIPFSKLSQSPLVRTQSLESPLTLEIEPDFMRSFDAKICKKFDENIWKLT